VCQSHARSQPSRSSLLAIKVHTMCALRSRATFLDLYDEQEENCNRRALSWPSLRLESDADRADASRKLAYINGLEERWVALQMRKAPIADGVSTMNTAIMDRGLRKDASLTEMSSSASFARPRSGTEASTSFESLPCADLAGDGVRSESSVGEQDASVSHRHHMTVPTYGVWQAGSAVADQCEGRRVSQHWPLAPMDSSLRRQRPACCCKRRPRHPLMTPQPSAISHIDRHRPLPRGATQAVPGIQTSAAGLACTLWPASAAAARHASFATCRTPSARRTWTDAFERFCETCLSTIGSHWCCRCSGPASKPSIARRKRQLCLPRLQLPAGFPLSSCSSACPFGTIAG